MAWGNRMVVAGGGLGRRLRRLHIPPMGSFRPHGTKVLSALAVAFTSWATAAAPASAQERPSAIAAAVRQFDPDLAIPEGGILHMADFDGDGREDVAAILTAPGRRALIVLRAVRGGYEPHPLYASLPPGEFELRLVPPGRHRVLDPQGMIEHVNPGLELVFPRRSSALYVWRDGRFRVFAKTD